MRVAVYYSNKDIRIEERPVPRIGQGEVLVKVEAAGICGSDVMEWYRKDKVPLVLGHEISGVVEEAASGIKGLKKGDRVVCAHHVPCGSCYYCSLGHEAVCDTLRKTNFDPGGFAQFLRLAPINAEKGVFKVPDNLSFEEATLVEPLACVMRGQRIAGGTREKCVVAIGSGIAGVLHIALARQSGARRILATDITEYRLRAAKGFGADISVNAQEYSPDLVRDMNEARLADLVIVSSGSPSAIAQAFASVERSGTILFFAPTDNKEIPIPFNRLFWRNEMSLVSSYAASPHDYKEALDLIAGKMFDIGAMITHRLKFDEIGLGFKLVVEAKESLKVIIYPQR